MRTSNNKACSQILYNFSSQFPPQEIFTQFFLDDWERLKSLSVVHFPTRTRAVWDSLSSRDISTAMHGANWTPTQISSHPSESFYLRSARIALLETRSLIIRVLKVHCAPKAWTGADANILSKFIKGSLLSPVIVIISEPKVLMTQTNVRILLYQYIFGPHCTVVRWLLLNLGVIRSPLIVKSSIGHYNCSIALVSNWSDSWSWSMTWRGPHCICGCIPVLVKISEHKEVIPSATVSSKSKCKLPTIFIIQIFCR